MTFNLVLSLCRKQQIFIFCKLALIGEVDGFLLGDAVVELVDGESFGFCEGILV